MNLSVCGNFPYGLEPSSVLVTAGHSDTARDSPVTRSSLKILYGSVSKFVVALGIGYKLGKSYIFQVAVALCLSLPAVESSREV